MSLSDPRFRFVFEAADTFGWARRKKG